MKSFLKSKNLLFYFLILLYTVIKNVEISFLVVISKKENCSESCNTCQKALYYIRYTQSSAHCQISDCIDTCIEISNRYNSNTYFNDFRENRVNICEACYRESYCHIQDCNIQKEIIHQAVLNNYNNYTFHSIMFDNQNKDTNINEINNYNMFDKIMKNSNDYYSNMDFILRNLEKLKNLINKLINNKKEIIDFKFYYKQILRKKISFDKVSNIDNILPILSSNNKENNINNYENSNMNDNIFLFNELSYNINILNHYYNAIKSKHLKLSEKKIYNVRGEKDIIYSISNFNQKIKNTFEVAYNITDNLIQDSLLQQNVLNNLAKITDILYSTTLDKDIKNSLLENSKYSKVPIDIVFQLCSKNLTLNEQLKLINKKIDKLDIHNLKDNKSKKIELNEKQIQIKKNIDLSDVHKEVKSFINDKDIKNKLNLDNKNNLLINKINTRKEAVDTSINTLKKYNLKNQKLNKANNSIETNSNIVYPENINNKKKTISNVKTKIDTTFKKTKDILSVDSNKSKSYLPIDNNTKLIKNEYSVTNRLDNDDPEEMFLIKKEKLINSSKSNQYKNKLNNNNNSDKSKHIKINSIKNTSKLLFNNYSYKNIDTKILNNSINNFNQNIKYKFDIKKSITELDKIEKEYSKIKIDMINQFIDI